MALWRHASGPDSRLRRPAARRRAARELHVGRCLRHRAKAGRGKDVCGMQECAAQTVDDEVLWIGWVVVGVPARHAGLSCVGACSEEAQDQELTARKDGMLHAGSMGGQNEKVMMPV